MAREPTKPVGTKPPPPPAPPAFPPNELIREPMPLGVTLLIGVNVLILAALAFALGLAVFQMAVAQ